jgi:nucleoside phosphorylase
MSNQDPVDIAILTALEEEYNAICELIDNIEFVRGTADDPNLYAWRIGHAKEYSVVIGWTGHAGNTRSALAAQNAIDRWNPRYLFFVGIAGGLKECKKGDVVIGNFIRGYEYGKMDKIFTPRNDWPYNSDIGLFTSAAAVKNEKKWHQYIKTDPPEHCDPEVVIGEIASGDKIIEDPSNEFFQQVLHEWPKIVAIEMEGAGVGEAIRVAQAKGKGIGFIMIRGISDLPRNNLSQPDDQLETRGTVERDNWKSFASATAAAFAYNFIVNYLPVPPLSLGKSRVGERTLLTLSQFKERAENSRLQEHDFIGRRAELANLYHFLDDSDKKIRLILGYGGIGKTRLAIQIAEKLEELGDWNVYFVRPQRGFCPFIIKGKTLLVLDEASRYEDRTKLLDFVLNPPFDNGSFKLIMLDRPMSRESIVFEQYGYNIEIDELRHGDLKEFLTTNYDKIDSKIVDAIVERSADSFVNATIFADYYLEKRVVPERELAIKERIQKYIKDVAIKTGKPIARIKEALDIISLLAPINWERDKDFLASRLFPATFEALEELLRIAFIDPPDLVVCSDGTLSIDPDPISDYIRRDFFTHKSFRICQKLLPLAPHRISYNIKAIQRLDTKIEQRIFSVLNRIWGELNAREDLINSREYLFAIDFLLGSLGNSPAFDMKVANGRMWSNCCRNLAQQYPNENFSESYINSVVGAATVFGRRAQFVELEKCVNDLSVFYKKTESREFHKGLARVLVTASQAFDNADNIEKNRACVARLRELHNFQDVEIAQWLARGLVNLIGSYGRAKQIGEMESYLAEIRDLCKKYDDLMLKRIIITAISNAIISYQRINAPEKIQIRLAELKSIQTSLPQKRVASDSEGSARKDPDPYLLLGTERSANGARLAEEATQDELELTIARAIFASSITFGNLGQFEEMESNLGELAKLYDGSQQEGLKEIVAAATSSAIAQYCKVYKFDKAEAHLASLMNLHVYPHLEIARSAASSLFSLIDAYAETSLLRETHTCESKLSSLCENYHDVQIIRTYAAALAQVSFQFGKLFQLAVVEESVLTAKKIAQDNVDIEIKRSYARCLRNAVVAYSSTGFFKETQMHLNTLQELFAASLDHRIKRSLTYSLWDSLRTYIIMKKPTFENLTFLYSARSVLLADGRRETAAIIDEFFRSVTLNKLHEIDKGHVQEFINLLVAELGDVETILFFNKNERALRTEIRTCIWKMLM